jgi:ubiquinone/menaquinone biosynthesis C-methylase UbiE
MPDRMTRPNRALAKMARVLCRGGTYFIGTSNQTGRRTA